MKRYTLEITSDSQKLSVDSKNDGFNAWELLGLITWKQLDIYKQISGDIKPDVIKRSIIKDDEPTDNPELLKEGGNGTEVLQ